MSYWAEKVPKEIEYLETNICKDNLLFNNQNEHKITLSKKDLKLIETVQKEW